MNTSSEQLVNVSAPQASGRCPQGSGAAQPEGVMSSNTPPQSSKWTGSEDWLEWSVYVEWMPTRFVKLMVKLEELKQFAADDMLPEIMTQWSVNGKSVKVDPFGSRLGNGKKGPYFAYHMECDGLVIMISQRADAEKNQPNVIIRANGETCLFLGSDACLKIGREFVVSLGGTIRKEKLSRVDIALDMPGVGMNEFISTYNERRYICRAKSRGITESSGVTIRIGESPLMLRIYDKLAETNKCANALKAFFVLHRCWGGSQPEQAVRVEYEIRREALKKRGIDSVDDYFIKRADLVHYLSHEWFRFTAEIVDRENKNQSRTKFLPLWKDVQATLRSWTGCPRGCSLAPLNLEKVNVKQLFKQALGVIKTAAKYQGKIKLKEKEFLAYAAKGLQWVLY